ncbi:DUF485 domain-containing protein [Microbacterium paludicola]|uniref:DUF485 domain-containing protein n=1 Tax=Microbacterium paludicola TaxID=300019 RepID=UPI0011A8AE64|nr:DUF485 domain-containing protein [Microbacterium paludicola]
MTDRPIDESAGGIDYIAVEESTRFQKLKRTQRSFIFPLAALFLIWYFVYVLLGAYATEFMGQRVWGDITVGLLLGLGQFVTTFAITMAYVSFANRKLDPKAQEIREELENAEVES